MIFTRFKIVFVLSVFVLSITQLYGCDISFSTNDDDGHDISDMESVSGRIVNVIPDIGVDGITVSITNSDDVTSDDVSDSTGNFTVVGDFDKSPAVVKFLDSDGVNLGSLNVNIFPGVDMDLGNVEIDEGLVTLDDDPMVIFFGDINAINCTGNEGSIDVEIKNVQVTVQINSSTDLERKNNNENITCDDLILGQEVRVDGDLLSPTGTIIDASDIQVQN